jgi:hypothetical protein
MRQLLKIFILMCSVALTPNAWAQNDEIIVTATRIDSSIPGLFLEVKGDFLLLEVSVENDSRDLETRLSEINKTMQGFISAAAKNPDITLSIVDEGDVVRPLTIGTFQSGIRRGSRPDTSRAFLKVKTQIPDTVADSYKLANKLGAFVENIPEVGRTTIDSYDEVAVSVVNPYQYRSSVIKLVTDEINSISQALGGNYRAVIEDIDEELKWVRSGDLNLAFYIPYDYKIIPANVTSITTNNYED